MAPPSLTIDEQKASLKEFKQLVTKQSWYKPSRHSSKLLKRFLIARGWNHDKALKMMSNTETWREKNDMDNITSFSYPEREQVSEIFVQYFHKVDKTGRPVRILQFDKADGNKLFAATTSERFMRMNMLQSEKEEEYYLAAAYEANSKSKRQMMVIVDLQGAYFSQVCTSLFLPLLPHLISLTHYHSIVLQIHLYYPWLCHDEAR